MTGSDGYRDPPRLTAMPRPGSFAEDFRLDDMRYAGRERYYDMTPEQRRDVLPRMVDLASRGWGAERAFAQGWLDELEAAKAVQP